MASRSGPDSLNRRDAFIYISGMSLDNYVDWETGRCSFDSEGFRSLAEFVKGFPEKSPLDEIDPSGGSRSASRPSSGSFSM